MRPPCSSRLRSNEKRLVDQLLLGQNLLKNGLGNFLNSRPLVVRVAGVIWVDRVVRVVEVIMVVGVVSRGHQYKKVF